MENINEIAKALCEFQAEDIVIIKNKVCIDKYGKEKYKYADLDGVIKTIRPYMKKYNLSYSQLLFGDNEKVTVKTILMHTSGQTLISEISVNLEKNKNQYMTYIQSEGTLITYLRRYSLSGILGLSSEEDTDGNNGKYEEKDNNNSSNDSGRATSHNPPKQPELPKNSNRYLFLLELTTMIDEISNKDSKKAKKLLELFTAFLTKDGKFVKGTQDTNILKKYTDARIKTTRDKVKTVYNNWKEGAALEVLEHELKVDLGLEDSSVNPLKEKIGD